MYGDLLSFNAIVIGPIFHKLYKSKSLWPWFTVICFHPCYQHISYVLVCSLDTPLWLWRGFPWTMFSVSHISFKSSIILFTNSRPLSNFNIIGAPKIQNMSIRCFATSALFVLKGLSWTNLVRWSWYWYTIINRNSPSPLRLHINQVHLAPTIHFRKHHWFNH